MVPKDVPMGMLRFLKVAETLEATPAFSFGRVIITSVSFTS